MSQSLQCSAGTNVHHLEARILSIGENLHGIARMELNRSNATFVKSRYICRSFTRSHVPESKTAVHVAGYGGERIRSHVQTVCGGTMTECCGLSVCVASNVPDFERSICRPGEYCLFSSKESHTSDLVSVPRELMYLTTVQS